MTEQIPNERITFRPSPARTRREMILFVVAMAFWVALVVHAALAPAVATVAYGLLGLGFLAYNWRKYRHGVVADFEGMHRPLRRVLPWAQVHAIEEPSKLRPELVLWCTDGKRRGTYLPIEYADQLSRISGRPIQSEKLLRRPLPKVEVRKTWQQEQDDFTARATRVKSRNAELLGEQSPTKRGADG